MADSPAFQRIERDLLRLCATIPLGRVCSYAALGAVIDVPARHVAYIVSRLGDVTRAQYPVHRLVGAGGKLPARPASLAQQLEEEGLSVQRGVVTDAAKLQFVPSAPQSGVEHTTRPPEHARGVNRLGSPTPALSELRGLGPASLQMLASVGITSATQLRAADVFALYARIKTLQPRTSMNLLYALLGAVDDQDWRDVAKDRRTEVLMRLQDQGLI